MWSSHCIKANPSDARVMLREQLMVQIGYEDIVIYYDRRGGLNARK